MNIPVWEFLLLAAVAVFAFYLRGLAGRLDRLHLRVEAAQDALDAQLLRRASAVLDLASIPTLDVASAFILVEAATTAQEARGSDREVAESALSQDLRAVLDTPGTSAAIEADPHGADRLAVLGGACARVGLARRFHNDAVRATLQLRRRRMVRWLHLAGRARLPRSFEMDDAPPAALPEVGAPGQ